MTQNKEYIFYSFDQQKKITLVDEELDKYPNCRFATVRYKDKNIFEQLNHFFKTGKWINPFCPLSPQLEIIDKDLSFKAVCKRLKLPYNDDIIDKYTKYDIYFYYSGADQFLDYSDIDNDNEQYE